MCLVVVAGNKRGGRPLVRARSLRTRSPRRIGEERRAGNPASRAGHKPGVHGTGIRGRCLKPGGGSGHEFARERAPRSACEARWPAPPVKSTVVPAVLHRPQGRRPPDTGATPGSARRPSPPAALAAGRRARASGRISVTFDGTGSPIARPHAATGVMAP
jgi:hypothetical protein